MKTNKFALKILFLFFLISPAYGQLSSRYREEIKKKLDPEVDSTTTKVVAVYVMKPSFKSPESSIRVIDINNKSFIEARFFNSNLWEAMISQSPDKLSSISTNYFSASISNSFRNKILVNFTKVIENNKSEDELEKLKKIPGQSVTIRLYDGPTYEFKVNNDRSIKHIIIKREPIIGDLYYKVTAISDQMFNDLKNGTFNESKYEIYK